MNIPREPCWRDSCCSPSAPARTASGAIAGVLLLWLAATPPATAGDIVREIEIKVAADTEVPVTVHAAEGGILVLWLPSEADQAEGEARVAAGLAARGIEVWRADLLSARLLPALRSAMHEIPAGDVAVLIEQAAGRSHKRVVLVSSGLGAGPLLRGALAWRARHAGSDALLGAVLLHPNLYVGTPEPGEEAQYLPEAARSDLRVVILQPDRSPLHWYVDRLAAELERGGGRVTVERLAGVRDRFHFRPDASAAETALAAELPARIAAAIERTETGSKP